MVPSAPYTEKRPPVALFRLFLHRLAMKKDGIALGDATLTLMTVALLYKLVLAVIGTGLLLFWGNGLTAYLGNYISLYGLGLFLNILLVVLLLLVMFHGWKNCSFPWKKPPSGLVCANLRKKEKHPSGG